MIKGENLCESFNEKRIEFINNSNAIESHIDCSLMSINHHLDEPSKVEFMIDLEE
jgi:hypothetical protein